MIVSDPSTPATDIVSFQYLWCVGVNVECCKYGNPPPVPFKHGPWPSLLQIGLLQLIHIWISSHVFAIDSKAFYGSSTDPSRVTRTCRFGTAYGVMGALRVSLVGTRSRFLSQ